MPCNRRQRIRLFFGTLAFALAMPLGAWELSGSKTLALHTRDGQRLVIGSVDFAPEGEQTSFALHLDHTKLKDFFLSMKEFKCVEGDEIHCHVPYPYANPAMIKRGDLRWLEHALLFLFKQPKDFGARLWNGLYYQMTITDQGIVGTPQAIDLMQIGAPPDDRSVPPYGPADRSDIPSNAHWINRLTIE